MGIPINLLLLLLLGVLGGSLNKYEAYVSVANGDLTNNITIDESIVTTTLMFNTRIHKTNSQDSGSKD